MMSFAKRFLSLSLACMLALSLAACGATNAGASSSASAAASSSPQSKAALSQPLSDTITVVDHLDNTVTLPRDIQRIVVCDPFPLPSVLTILFDSAEKIVGMPAVSMNAAKNGLLGELYPEILNASTDFLEGTKVNMEELLKLTPDVVFYSASNKELGQQLAQAGVPAVSISAGKWDYDAVETLNQWVALLGQMFPENDKATAVASYSKAAYDDVQTRVKSLSDTERARAFFLFQYSDTSMATAGTRAFGNWWAQAIGAVNVSAELEGENSAAVNMEQVYKWNPDLIFVTNFNAAKPEDLYTNAIGNYDWSSVSAVQNKQVYKMPLGMFRSYTCGVDTPVTLYWLAKTAYPDLFADIDILTQTKQYYETVFGITLTDEQAARIFAPAADATQGTPAAKSE